MDHVAFMRKSWGLLPKILSGEKKIESRWYKFRHTPWNSIQTGDTIYFKNSGELVTTRTKVKEVRRYEGLEPEGVLEILGKYGEDDGISSDQIPVFYERFKDKKYCLLIFLEKVEKITPFEINKKGFGAMSAWITIDNVSIIKVHA